MTHENTGYVETNREASKSF